MALNRVTKIDKSVKINNVLISVSDKSNIENSCKWFVRRKLCYKYIFHRWNF